MKIGDLIYPFIESGDYTIGIYLGREFTNWKSEPHGIVFFDGDSYPLPLHQLKLVSEVTSENR
jgi:hypothetical protein